MYEENKTDSIRIEIAKNKIFVDAIPFSFNFNIYPKNIIDKSNGTAIGKLIPFVYLTYAKRHDKEDKKIRIKKIKKGENKILK